MGKRIAIDINDVLRDYTRQFANVYKKFVNPSFDIAYEDIDDFDLLNIFPFADENGTMDRYFLNRFKYEILVSSLLDDRWGVKHIATLNLQDQLPPIEIAAVTCPKQGFFNMRIDPSLLVES